MNPRVLSCFALLGCASAFAAEPAAGSPPAAAQPAPTRPEPAPPATPPAPQAPAVVKLDETRFRVGEVEFDQKTRAIRFPAAVNMREGLLEYAIVHENGKVHESLLNTKVNPTHINLAFKLLRYKASGELFPLLEEDDTVSDKFPEVDAATKAAARVAVRVLWKDGQESKSASLNEWIGHALTHQPMPPGPWVYGGSFFVEDRFHAETSGDVAAIFTSRGALLNFPGKDSDNDEVWTPLTKRIPPEGSPVTVEITPWKP